MCMLDQEKKHLTTKIQRLNKITYFKTPFYSQTTSSYRTLEVILPTMNTTQPQKRFMESVIYKMCSNFFTPYEKINYTSYEK